MIWVRPRDSCPSLTGEPAYFLHDVQRVSTCWVEKSRDSLAGFVRSVRLVVHGVVRNKKYETSIIHVPMSVADASTVYLVLVRLEAMPTVIEPREDSDYSELTGAVFHPHYSNVKMDVLLHGS